MSSTIDQAKILSACLGLVKLELQKHTHSIQEQIAKSSIGKNSQLRKEILEAAIDTIEVPIKELPPGLVYEVHLDDLKFDLKEEIAGVNAHYNLLVDQLKKDASLMEEAFYKHNHNNDYSLVEHLHDERYVLEEQYSKQKLELLESLKTLETAQEAASVNLSRRIETATTDLSAALEESVENVLALITNESIQVRSLFDSHTDKVKIISENLTSEIIAVQALLKSDIDSTKNDFDFNLSNLRTVIGDQYRSISDEMLRINERLNKKSDLNHSHPDLAKLDHQHPDLVSQSTFNSLRQDFTQHTAKISSIDLLLSKLKKEIDAKAGKTDVLTVKDLDSLSEQIKIEVMKTIRQPEDGKDAKEWVFQFHPEKRGLLMYKREDWKTWNYQNLLGPTNYVDNGYGFGGGGSITVDSGLNKTSVSDEGNVVNPDVSNFNFTGNLVDVKTTLEGVEINIDSKTGEPTGYPNRTDSYLSFDDETRTFTISPTNEYFDVFVGGNRLRIVDPISIQIDDVTGTHYFYFDSVTQELVTTNVFNSDIFRKHAITSVVYWQEDQQEAIYFADERHGIVMDGATHAHFHLSFGAQYRFGLGLQNILADESGEFDSHTQFGVQSGRIADEDLEIDILDDSPQQLTKPATIPVFYRVGGDGNWYKTSADAFAFLMPGDSPFYSGTNRPAYNKKVSGQWGLYETPQNKFFLMHYYATNNIVEPVIGIIGGEYDSKSSARAGANVELLSIEGLPFLEFVPIASVIFEVNNSYINTARARIVSTDTGADYIDWRNSRNISSSESSSNGGTQLIKKSVALSGKTQTITFLSLGIQDFYSYKVTNSLGYEVSVVIRENGSQFIIESNVEMSGLTFVVRGF